MLWFVLAQIDLKPLSPLGVGVMVEGDRCTVCTVDFAVAKVGESCASATCFTGAKCNAASQCECDTDGTYTESSGVCSEYGVFCGVLL